MSKRVLVVAEGERAERRFFDSMKGAFRLDFTFCCLRGNIYLLYKKMKEMDFNTDVKSVLVEMHPEYRERLSGRFAYTYLVFDMDPHHSKKNDTRTIDALVHDNCQIIQEMVAYFTDETDPSIGRLYVNYPMLESFRSCDSVFDEKYRYEFVRLEHRMKRRNKSVAHNAQCDGRHEEECPELYSLIVHCMAPLSAVRDVFVLLVREPFNKPWRLGHENSRQGALVPHSWRVQQADGPIPDGAMETPKGEMVHVPRVVPTDHRHSVRRSIGMRSSDTSEPARSAFPTGIRMALQEEDRIHRRHPRFRHL